MKHLFLCLLLPPLIASEGVVLTMQGKSFQDIYIQQLPEATSLGKAVEELKTSLLVAQLNWTMALHKTNVGAQLKESTIQPRGPQDNSTPIAKIVNLGIFIISDTPPLTEAQGIPIFIAVDKVALNPETLGLSPQNSLLELRKTILEKFNAHSLSLVISDTPQLLLAVNTDPTTERIATPEDLAKDTLQLQKENVIAIVIPINELIPTQNYLTQLSPLLVALLPLSLLLRFSLQSDTKKNSKPLHANPSKHLQKETHPISKTAH